MADADRYEAFARFEQNGWQHAAATYHQSAGSLTMPFAEALIEALGESARGRLLDIATGPGYIAGLAAARGAGAVGTDFADAMVLDAAQRYPDAHFRAADAEDLPFADADFDAVAIGFGILHFAHAERALAEAYRVLRPGGRIGFTVWSDEVGPGAILMPAIAAHGVLDVGLKARPTTNSRTTATRDRRSSQPASRRRRSRTYASNGASRRRRLCS